MILNEGLWNEGYNLLCVDTNNRYVKLKHYTNNILFDIDSIEVKGLLIDKINKVTLNTIGDMIIYVFHTTIDHLKLDINNVKSYLCEYDKNIPDEFKNILKITNKSKREYIRIRKDNNDETKMIFLNKWINGMLFNKYPNFKFSKWYDNETHTDISIPLNIVLQNDNITYGIVATNIINGKNINIYSLNDTQHDDHVKEGDI